MKNIYPLGVVVGKFYPFHKGHEFLIQQALTQSKKLIVYVISNKNDLINASIRAKWIAQTFEKIDVRVAADIGHDDDSRLWADYTIKLVGRAPDAVFTSESYGKTWAEELGCTHVEVDKARIKFPISGTKVRSDPLKYWDMLPDTTRQFFTFKVVLIGAESTGKSTLACALAKSLKTNWVHEYGRYYTELRRHNRNAKSSKETGIELEWTEQDFVNIAETQNIIAKQLGHSANKILISDTDAFATHIWHFRYLKKWSSKVKKLADEAVPDLYLVTPPDIPYEQDGTRDGKHIRSDMHEWVVDSLVKAQRPFHIVTGGTNFGARLADAEAAIETATDKWAQNKCWSDTHTSAL